MKFKIGEVYVFDDYQKLHDVKRVDSIEYINCTLNIKEKEKLITDIIKNKENIEQYFNIQKEDDDLQEYFKLIKKYNKIVQKRKDKGIRKKSKQEIELKDIIESTKDFYFPKNKKRKKDNIEARNLFIRYFEPKNIIIDKKYYKDINYGFKNNKIVALYSGKFYTSKGLIVHKWYILNYVNIPKNYITNNIIKYITEKNNE